MLLLAAKICPLDSSCEERPLESSSLNTCKDLAVPIVTLRDWERKVSTSRTVRRQLEVLFLHKSQYAIPEIPIVTNPSSPGRSVLSVQRFPL